MNIEYKQAEKENYEGIRQFLSEQGWQQRVSDADKFAEMLGHTSRTVVATENGRIIGFARALCDGVSNGYISMVAVAPEKRRQGIGRELIKRLMGQPGEETITWVLHAGRESKQFWEKMGFKASEIAMEKLRK